MRASPVGGSLLSKGGSVALFALAAVGLSLALGLSSSAPAASAEVGCFGGPPIGSACGTLSEASLHSLVSDLTLAQKVGLVHGQGETTDPLTGCGNTGQPNAFPVINPGATGSALVAGCVGQAGVNNGVKGLGIPPLRQTDGPAGVRLSHQETGLPAPVGLTATFDRDAANAYGSVIGREGRATNQDVLYAPMINQVAFQTAGRNFETLGEDPFLAGELVADETLGVQSEGLIVTLKHMAMNDFENSRTNTAIKLDERMLHELELQAFEKGIEEGHAGSIMCAYSRISQSDTGLDTYSCGNNLLLNDDRARHVRLHGLGADRLRRDPPAERHPRRRRLGDAERQQRRHPRRARPGQPQRPALQQQRLRERRGLPRRRAGQRQDADPGCAERDECDPGQRQLPGDPGHERRAVGSGARQGGLPHPHLDEPCPAARRHAVRLAERRLHRGRRELHARLAGAAEPRDADESRLRDREGRGGEERDAAQEQRRRSAAEGRRTSRAAASS